jgi:hypothetical protein
VHIAASAARVAVTLNDEILVLDSDGALQARRSLAALGIASAPIDLRWRDANTLLVATQKPAGLYACAYPAWQCRAVDNPLFNRLKAQIKVLPEGSDGGFFISDTATGRLYRLDAQDGSTRTLAGSQRFDHINDIALDAQRRLWVADSGNRRIVILQAAADGDWAVADELSASTGPGRPGLDWPMMIALSPAGTAWVVQPDAMGKRADLLLYDAQRGATTRIDLPADAFPTDVALSGRSMLVTDMDHFRILGVDIDSHAVTAFGDQRLQEVLDATAREKADSDRMTTVGLAGMVLFGVLMLALAYWATPRGQRLSRSTRLIKLEARPAAGPRNGGLHWLETDPKTSKFLRLTYRLLQVVVLGIFGLMAYLWYLLDTLDQNKLAERAAACIPDLAAMLGVTGVLVVGALLLAWLSFRPMRNRLGSDGRYLHVRLHDGQRLALDPARLVYTNRILAYGKHLFPVQTGNRKPLYAGGELETHIFPLLTHATRLGMFAMLRYQIGHREPVTIASLAYVVGGALLLWYTGMWRLMLSGN